MERPGYAKLLTMTKGRLEAFSDGVLAIIITIMVLELKVPHTADWDALKPLWPVLLSYFLSYLFIGIYWNNHHHLLQAAHQVTGGILWANMHLLFWLSLIPFTTAWMGENDFAPLPVALYGADLFAAGAAYYILAHSLAKHHGRESALAKALGSDHKGKLSVLLYAIAIPLAFVNARIAYTIYGIVAAVWLIPDRRVERVLKR